MDISLDSLETLDAVVKFGGFSAAAAELGKAQSGVSYSISRLERQLDVQLFDRTHHRAELTDAGKMVLAEARSILSGVRRLRATCQELQLGWEAKLDIVIDGALNMLPILGALKQLAEENVPTTIRIKIEFLGGVAQRFNKDRADMMLVKHYEPDAGHVTRQLPDVTSILVAGAQHPLAELEDVRLEDLHRFVELSVHDTSDSGEFVDDTMFGGERVFYLSDFNAKLQALLQGLGFGWLPTTLAEPELRAGRIRELRYQPSRYTFTPLLVHRADRSLGLAGRRFLELIGSQ